MNTSPNGAKIVVRRRLAWCETDAAGHQHFTAVFRWIEEAEHELYRLLGLEREMTAHVPRVHLEVDYSERIFFGDEFNVEVGVSEVGRSSARFRFTVTKSEGTLAASGRYVVVHVAGTTAGAEPWPMDARDRLLSGTSYRVRVEDEQS